MYILEMIDTQDAVRTGVHPIAVAVSKDVDLLKTWQKRWTIKDWTFSGSDDWKCWTTGPKYNLYWRIAPITLVE